MTSAQKGRAPVACGKTARPIRYPARVNPRRSVRAGVAGAFVATTFLAPVLAAAPAFALDPDDGDDPGPPISALEVVLIFGVIPIGVFLLIALLVSLPSIVNGPRYRPGLGWQGAPQWYGAPGAERPAVDGGYGQPAVAAQQRDPDAALTGRIVSGGAAGAPAAESAAEETGDGGGTSARW